MKPKSNDIPWLLISPEGSCFRFEEDPLGPVKRLIARFSDEFDYISTKDCYDMLEETLKLIG